ncbi:uncharacterized protein LOC113290857 [Papaver somniferum]|uniref:uncharacterized protein LOC113290857 n=1 Tax=Papaver somniferum TaxID=3469 RepID=UPI000E7032B4|nr:uncharacterized protein LOC113290857 [Papaver somniferum]
MDQRPNIRISTLLLNIIANSIPLKLKDDTLITWKALLLPFFKKLQVEKFIDGSFPCPDQGNTRAQLAEYQDWIAEDTIILLWIQSTISDSVISYVAGADTSRGLWLSIQERFSHTSATHVIQLRTKLQYLKMNSSVLKYLMEIKNIQDQLAAAGSQISDTEMVGTILSGLPLEYNYFATSIRIRNPPVFSKELFNLLMNEEIVVNNTKTDYGAKAFAAQQYQQYRPNSSYPPRPSYSNSG